MWYAVICHSVSTDCLSNVSLADEWQRQEKAHSFPSLWRTTIRSVSAGHSKKLWNGQLYSGMRVQVTNWIVVHICQGTGVRHWYSHQKTSEKPLDPERWQFQVYFTMHSISIYSFHWIVGWWKSFTISHSLWHSYHIWLVVISLIYRALSTLHEIWWMCLIVLALAFFTEPLVSR